MTLSFSQKYKDGTPNSFIEKIWNSLGLMGVHYREKWEYVENYEQRFDKKWRSSEIVKKHTIRKDLKDRWKVGNKIHFVINNRTKNRFQFAPVVEVKAVQKIEIRFVHNYIDRKFLPNVYIDGELFFNPHWNDNGWADMKQLAKNDGFESVEQFFEWFSEDFDGKIIHWTDKIY